VDEIIVAEDDPKQTDFNGLTKVDVVLDYVYGPLCEHLLSSLKSSVPVQYINVGNLSKASNITLPDSVLRSKQLTLMGSGIGSWTMSESKTQLPGLLTALTSLPQQKVRQAD
jgi:NADPH:quinone reductase-like Zn-dependent oxidoreductase